MILAGGGGLVPAIRIHSCSLDCNYLRWQQVPPALSWLGQIGIEVDQYSHSLRHGLGNTSDHHGRYSCARQGQPRGRPRTQAGWPHPLCGVEIDGPAEEVRTVPQAGQGRIVDAVAGRSSSRTSLSRPKPPPKEPLTRTKSAMASSCPKATTLCNASQFVPVSRASQETAARPWSRAYSAPQLTTISRQRFP